MGYDLGDVALTLRTRLKCSIVKAGTLRSDNTCSNKYVEDGKHTLVSSMKRYYIFTCFIVELNYEIFRANFAIPDNRVLYYMEFPVKY